jgi:DNA gyrase, B subunit
MSTNKNKTGKLNLNVQMKQAIDLSLASGVPVLFLSNPGCFTEDTKVVTDKGELTFKELLDRHNQGEIFKVVSWDTDTQKEINPAMKSAFITKEVDELIEVELSNGEIYRCTPDHLHLLADGKTWVAAEELTVGQEVKG